MGGQSKILKVLPNGYGFVVLTATGSVFLNIWLAHNVMAARKKYNIQPPIMYSPENNDFNCIQRAHQNTLELWPQFLTLLLLGGLQLPKVTAAAGCVYLLGRISYAKGYYSGDHEKINRVLHVCGVLGMLVMLGNTICFAAHQLHWSHSKGFFGSHGFKKIKLSK